MTGRFNRGWVQRLRVELRKMWVRVVLYSLAGVLLALLAPLIGPILPYVPKIDLASGSVDALLNIIASSMLAVTTFSMSILVGAYGSATSNATPRATRLLEEDRTAQTAVSIFIGSFLFSIVGIIGLSAGLYSDNARVLLFVATLGDIALIAWALVRWVNHLNDFGRMSDIIARIETAAKPAPAKAKPKERPSASTRQRAAAKTSLPDDFAITPELQAWADKHHYGDLDPHLDNFRDKVAANGYRYADWVAAFRNAVREDWAKLRTFPDTARTRSRNASKTAAPQTAEAAEFESILQGLRTQSARPVIEGECYATH